MIETIKSEICDILQERFDVYLKDSQKNSGENNFFGSKIRFKSRDMLYLMLILEEYYGVIFSERDVDNEHFYTLDGLTQIISDKLLSLKK